MPSRCMPKQLLFGQIEGAKRARFGLDKKCADVVQEDVEPSGLAMAGTSGVKIGLCGGGS